MQQDPILERVRRVTVGDVERRRVVLVEHDPAWAARAATLLGEVRAALADRVDLAAHVGSTAVPGLVAKPIVDLVVTVAAPDHEAAWLPALTDLGWELRVREPDWFSHRMLRTAQRDAHLHVFPTGCVEVGRMLALRDRLRHDPAARARYGACKQRLAARAWPTMQHYADAKGEVVEEILAQAPLEAPGEDDTCAST